MAEEELPKFGEMKYWDDGYKTGEAPKEWFLPYQTFKEFVEKNVPKESDTLVIGCGTSSLSIEMYDSGYKTLQSMDYSPEAIHEMQEAYPHLVWKIEDVRNMSYATGQFDAIVDKGTLDCLFFLDETNESILKMLKEVYRVLKPDGRYVVVTCGCPMQRMDVFYANKELKWDVLDWEEYIPPEGQKWTHPSAFVYYLKKRDTQ